MFGQNILPYRRKKVCNPFCTKKTSLLVESAHGGPEAAPRRGGVSFLTRGKKPKARTGEPSERFPHDPILPAKANSASSVPIPPRSIDFTVERKNDRTLASDRGAYANRGHEACEVHSDDGPLPWILPGVYGGLQRTGELSLNTTAFRRWASLISILFPLCKSPVPRLPRGDRRGRSPFRRRGRIPKGTASE